jgi:NAD-specific glutamate dehydrogenase
LKPPALLDLKRLEKIERDNLSALGFLYSPLTASGQKQLYFKLYCFGHIASLSRSLPMLENMGKCSSSSNSSCQLDNELIIRCSISLTS